jgi:hypothetical protein
MTITSDAVQLAASNPASVPTVMLPRLASATCGSYGDNTIGEQLATWARTPIGLAFLLTAGTLLGFVLMKLLVLLGWAMDWAWLRDNPIFRSGSDNCPHGAACVVAAGGAGGGSSGKGQPRGGKPPEKGPKDPVPAGMGGGNPSPGSYTPTKGSDPLHDPQFQNAQNQYLSHNPQATPSQPASGGNTAVGTAYKAIVAHCQGR